MRGHPRVDGKDLEAALRRREHGDSPRLLTALGAQHPVIQFAKGHGGYRSPIRQRHLDPFGRGVMPKAFEDAAFALKPGELSAPVATPQGWHLILLDERIAASSVPLDAATRDRIRAYLRTTRGQEGIDREVEQLRSIGKVEILTPL